MKLFHIALGALTVWLCPVPSLCAEPPVRVLLLSGQNNHKWQETTPKLKEILARTGELEVDVTQNPEEMTTNKLAKYDVVVSDWNTFGAPSITNWSEPVKKAFIEFVKAGKGFVVVHAGGSSFYDWPEYQELAAVYWQNGQTSHGPPHRFKVELEGHHPITDGMEPFYTTDELWVNPGVHRKARVIARAEGNALAVVSGLGRGRGFGLLLGHDARFMETPGFAALLVRGTRWAAARPVTAAK